MMAFVVGLSAVVGACGGGNDDVAGDKESQRTGTTTVAVASTAGNDPGTSTMTPPISPPMTAAPNNGNPSPASTAPPTTAAQPPLDVKVEVSSACVRPGGTQTFSVDLGESGVFLWYVLYQNGQLGPAENERTDDGKFTTTFTVEPGTEPGLATVKVQAGANYGRKGEGQATFEVAGLTGKC